MEELPQVERWQMSDQELFEALDPDYPGMCEVIAAGQKESTETALELLADHFRTREEPVWFVDPQMRGKEEVDCDLEAADKALDHVFTTHGVTHHFGEDIDWLDNPTWADAYEFDKEWSMAFLRMPWWVELGKAYWATGDEKYAREFVEQFLDFRRKHPIPVEKSQWFSEHPLKYTVPEWRTLETGGRLAGSWMEAFMRFLSSPSFTDRALCEMLKAFWEMAEYLRRYSSVREVSHNWLIYETRGLYTAGLLFPEFASAGTWRETAEKRLATEIEKQVYPDGVQWELAPGYGAGVLRAFQRVQRLGAKNGRPLPVSFVDRLEKMYEYFLYSSALGEMPAFGDSGHGDVRELLKMGAETFPDRKDFLWMATRGREGEPPPETDYAFPWAGQYVMRSRWDPGESELFLIVNGGPYGTNHQHEDHLSFELAAFGERLITDPGSYRYNYDSPWRKFMVSSLAHNTLAVDGEGQRRGELKETWIADEPSPCIWQTADQLTYFRGIYSDGYGSGGRIAVDQMRSIFFVRNRYWVFIDQARPRDEKEHLYEFLFMFDSDQVERKGNRVICKSGEAGLVLAIPEGAGQLDLVSGQHEPVRRGWRRGGKTVVPNPVAVVSLKTAGPVAVPILLYPFAKGNFPSGIDIARREAEGKGDPVAAAVSLPGEREEIIVDARESSRVKVEGANAIAAPGIDIG